MTQTPERLLLEIRAEIVKTDPNEGTKLTTLKQLCRQLEKRIDEAKVPETETWFIGMSQFALAAEKAECDRAKAEHRPAAFWPKQVSTLPGCGMGRWVTFPGENRDDMEWWLAHYGCQWQEGN